VNSFIGSFADGESQPELKNGAIAASRSTWTHVALVRESRQLRLRVSWLVESVNRERLAGGELLGSKLQAPPLEGDIPCDSAG
jgi:hypothetical protein